MKIQRILLTIIFSFLTLGFCQNDKTILNPVYSSALGNLHVYSITLTPQSTILNFSGIFPSVCIGKKTYLYDKKNNLKYKLIDKNNINFCEEDNRTKANRFSLIFEKLNDNTNSFDFVETGESLGTPWFIEEIQLFSESSSTMIYSRIKNFVEGEITLWQKREEFEKTSVYVDRVSEQNRQKKIREYERLAIHNEKENYRKSINWDNVKLSRYDADNETFLVTVDKLEGVILNVNIAKARFFKNRIDDIIIRDQDFILTNDGFKVVHIEFKIPDTNEAFSYNLDEKNSYSFETIQYNFDDLHYTPQLSDYKNKTNIYKKNTVIGKDIVDLKIPLSNIKLNNCYALIIGNEDYTSKQVGLTTEQNVPYAINDAAIFAKYCERTIGVPKKQIKVLKNATSAEINRGLSWLNNLIKIEKGNAKVIFYYSGHGLPHEKTKEPYIIPVDVSGSNLDYAIKLTDIYKKLTEFPSKQATVFLDACFSGAGRNESILVSKGVRITPRENVISGNLVVFSSSTGSESSSVYWDKQHGYFTYYLLKKLKETKAKVDYESLSQFIIQNVSKGTGLEGKIQTPQVLVGRQAENVWQTWTLK